MIVRAHWGLIYLISLFEDNRFFFYEIFLRYHDSLIYVFAKIRMIINLMVFEEVLFSNFAAVF